MIFGRVRRVGNGRSRPDSGERAVSPKSGTRGICISARALMLALESTPIMSYQTCKGEWLKPLALMQLVGRTYVAKFLLVHGMWCSPASFQLYSYWVSTLLISCCFNLQVHWYWGAYHGTELGPAVRVHPKTRSHLLFLVRAEKKVLCRVRNRVWLTRKC